MFLGLVTNHHRVSSSRLSFWGVSLSIQCPEFMGSWKVNISTDLFSFHPKGSRFWKRDIVSEAAAQYMWSTQNGMENSSRSDLLPPSLTVPWRLGTQRAQRPPSGPPASAVVRWVARNRRRASGPHREGAAWGRPGLVDATNAAWLLKAPFSSSVKLYFSYQKFGLIYIYTNIYINISISTVILLN